MSQIQETPHRHRKHAVFFCMAPKSNSKRSPVTPIDQGCSVVSNLVMGMDSSGNAEVVWQDSINGMTERRYAATTGTWGAFNASTAASRDLSLDMSDTGYAVLLGSSTTTLNIAFMRNAWSWILTP